jgi:glycosyltransferase involved in cell wall biosynthesis
MDPCPPASAGNVQTGLVSVVMACLDGEKYLAQALDSALSQKGCDFEILVVDDGSTDGSRRIMESRGQGLEVLTHPGGVNQGQPASLNLAVSRSRGEYVAFMDADDVWIDEYKLARQKEALNRVPGAVLAFCNCYMVDADGGRQVPKLTREPAHYEDRENLFLDCFILPSGVMARRCALDAAGPMVCGLLPFDHDLWIRMAELGPVVYQPEPMFWYRLHHEQMSRKKGLWQGGFQVVDRAAGRGRHSSSLLRRRRAVLHYRLGQHARTEGDWQAWLGRMAMAVLHDPCRSIREVGRRCIGRRRKD